MIGIFIHPFFIKDPDKVSPYIYHKFNGKAVLETVIDNALTCNQAHRVICLMPHQERKNFVGNKYGNPAIIDIRRSALKRACIFEFYEDVDALDAMYYSAMQHGLTTIVRVSGTTPFLPDWVLNGYLEKYFTNKCQYFNSDLHAHGDGFYFEIFPFWFLARQFQDKAWNIPEVNICLGAEDITKCNKDLVLRSPEQFEYFNTMLHNIELGYDINELIEEINNGEQEKVHQ